MIFFKLHDCFLQQFTVIQNLQKKYRSLCSFRRDNWHELAFIKILATAPVKGMFILSVYATFGRNWKHSFKVILKITK